jgi:hypothetical protein
MILDFVAQLFSIFASTMVHSELRTWFTGKLLAAHMAPQKAKCHPVYQQVQRPNASSLRLGT